MSLTNEIRQIEAVLNNMRREQGNLNDTMQRTAAVARLATADHERAKAAAERLREVIRSLNAALTTLGAGILAAVAILIWLGFILAEQSRG